MTTPRILRRAAVLALAAAAPASAARALQAGPQPSFADPVARELHQAARAARLESEREVLGYTALVRQRAAAALRMPVRDRTLYHQEGASRVFWSRDGEVLVQRLGGRELEPGDREARPDDSWSGGAVFDPGGTGDRLYLGLVVADDDEGFHDPLGVRALEHYRFRSGDTLSLSLPDGRSLRIVELEAIPLTPDPRRLVGSLWIEPESGALVRAMYRMSRRLDVERDLESDPDLRLLPGVFKPVTWDLSLVTVEYSLWDFRVWLPRSLRAEGTMAAGLVRAPLTAEVSYRFESVHLRGDVESALPSPEAASAAAAGAGALPPEVREVRHFRTRSEALAHLAELMGAEGEAYAETGIVGRSNGRTVRTLLPTDREALLRSPELPPPVWQDAPGFIGPEQLRSVLETLERLSAQDAGGVAWAFNWGPERPDLLRFNRVEGLGVGARLQLRWASPAGPLSLSLVPFVGVADLAPKARLTLERETLRRRFALAAYRELEPVSREGRHLGLGNSASALLLGRDEGEYFLASGAEARLSPASARRPSWELRVYAERQAAVETATGLALPRLFDRGWRFRENVQAEPGTEVGSSFTLSPWWGRDPLAPQGGVELFGQAATGTRDWARVSVTARTLLPLGSGLRLGAEAAAGESWGEAPLQRHWFLGGPLTLRGWGPSVAVGPAFGRGRLELAGARAAVGLTVFGDAAWAGEGLGTLRREDVLTSVGAGVSLLDGVLRLDLARGLGRGGATRLHLYLNGVL